MGSTGNIAWLLNIAADSHIAVAECELLEYAMPEQLQNVPASSAHCSHVFLWRAIPVPVMELSLLLGNSAPSESITGICVVAYQRDSDAPLNYVGLPVLSPPAKIDIAEDQACSPPDDPDRLWSLPDMSLAYFSHADATVPIVNIEELCATKNRGPLSLLHVPDDGARALKSA